MRDQGLLGWKGSVHHWKHVGKHVQALVVRAKLHGDSEEMLQPCVLSAHHSWDGTWMISQGRFMWVVAQQPRNISSLLPAERSVSDLFEVR